MNSHHNYLKDDLKITTPEIDKMIDVSLKMELLVLKLLDLEEEVQ